MKLTTVLTLFLATSALSAHAQALDRAQSHDVPMMSEQTGEIVVSQEDGFASPAWKPSTGESEPGGLNSVAAPEVQSHKIRCAERGPVVAGPRSIGTIAGDLGYAVR